MPRPIFSWMPVRLIPDVVESKTLTTEDWLNRAPDFGFQFVDLHSSFLGERTTGDVNRIAERIDDLGLTVSMLSCFLDLTDPDPSTRRRQMSQMELDVEIAHRLGARMLMLAPGPSHPDISDEYAISLIEDTLLGLSEFASPLDVRLALGNYQHIYSDTKSPGFAASTDLFLKLYEHVRTLPVRIDFDCSSPLLTDEDPVRLLQAVRERVGSVHASDRRAGEDQYTVIGEGSVPFDRIFESLAEVEFSGNISVVDGSPEGDEGLRRSVKFLSRMIDEYWPVPAAERTG